jgi:hypothetical protein
MSFSLGVHLRRLQLSSTNILIGRAGAFRGKFEPLRKFNPALSERHRTLLTAVTASQTIYNKYPGDVPPPSVLYGLVDAALAWASQAQKSDDPPSHAIILVNKSLIPKEKDKLLQALGQSTRLCGLNALVGVVDAVGEGATGVSVLLASRSEKVTIDTLISEKSEPLRVGKWHAKDEENDEAMDFDSILSLVRGGKAVEAVPQEPSSKQDLVFVIGEMEAVHNRAANINAKYPTADIVWNHCCRTNL